MVRMRAVAPLTILALEHRDQPGTTRRPSDDTPRQPRGRSPGTSLGFGRVRGVGVGRNPGSSWHASATWPCTPVARERTSRSLRFVQSGPLRWRMPVASIRVQNCTRWILTPWRPKRILPLSLGPTMSHPACVCSSFGGRRSGPHPVAGAGPWAGACLFASAVQAPRCGTLGAVLDGDGRCPRCGKEASGSGRVERASAPTSAKRERDARRVGASYGHLD
jgi:hypothetical protein